MTTSMLSVPSRLSCCIFLIKQTFIHVFVSAATGEGSAVEPLDCRTTEDTPETGTTNRSIEKSHQTVPSGRGWSLRIKHA